MSEIFLKSNQKSYLVLDFFLPHKPFFFNKKRAIDIYPSKNSQDLRLRLADNKCLSVYNGKSGKHLSTSTEK